MIPWIPCRCMFGYITCSRRNAQTKKAPETPSKQIEGRRGAAGGNKFFFHWTAAGTRPAAKRRERRIRTRHRDLPNGDLLLVPGGGGGV